MMGFKVKGPRGQLNGSHWISKLLILSLLLAFLSALGCVDPDLVYNVKSCEFIAGIPAGSGFICAGGKIVKML
jgi:hypothetical protein